MPEEHRGVVEVRGGGECAGLDERLGTLAACLVTLGDRLAVPLGYRLDTVRSALVGPERFPQLVVRTRW